LRSRLHDISVSHLSYLSTLQATIWAAVSLRWAESRRSWDQNCLWRDSQSKQWAEDCTWASKWSSRKHFSISPF
jgi:hypothetical protein